MKGIKRFFMSAGFSLAITVTASIAVTVLPSATAFALYTGPQIERDEHDTCCTSWSGPWNTYYGGEIGNSNGYDDDSRWAAGGQTSAFFWYPYPASTTFMCPFVHIPAISYAFAQVTYTEYITGGPNEKDQYYQQYDHNYWEPLAEEYFTSSDKVEITDNMSAQETFAADVISFHYDDPSCY